VIGSRFFRYLAKKLADRLSAAGGQSKDDIEERQRRDAEAESAAAAHSLSPRVGAAATAAAASSSSSSKSSRRKKGGGKSSSRAPSIHSLPPSADVGTAEQDEDASFQVLFSLPPDEIIVKECDISIKSGVVKQQGKLYVSANYICFSAKAFSRKSKQVLSMADVAAIAASKGALRIDTKARKTYRFKLKSALTASDIAALVRTLTVDAKSSSKRSGASSSSSPPSSATETPESALMLMVDDWDEILAGAKSQTFASNETVVAQGMPHGRIYQIGSGRCRIEKRVIVSGTDAKEMVKTLGFMDAKETFGEISLLKDSGASASVVADSDTVQVYYIDAYFLYYLIEQKPALGTKLYLYLCNVLSDRLKQRELALLNK
jgi:CRP-like cAMP-binding protein